jgi:N-acetylmuramoyl-L-alanine amidase
VAAAPATAAARIGARIAVLDRAGLPCLAPARLQVTAARPGVAPAETVVTSRDGVAWAYLRLAPAARVGGVVAKVRALGGGTVHGASLTLAARRPGAPAAWSGWAKREPEGGRLVDAPGTAEPDPARRWINRDGFVALEPGDTTAPALQGFRVYGRDTLPPRFTAIAGGALHGRRILLDPDGGGEESGGMGPSGTRAALYNMEVAQALASYLEAAGAAVALARSGDVAASDVERVRVSESFHADRYLRIGHRAEPPRVGFYFSSAVGKTWGERTAAWLGRLGLESPPVRDDAQYPLQQTSSTALYVSARRVDQPASEDAMNAAGAARAEAYALYLGVLGEWTRDTGWEVDSIAVRDPEGRPAAGALVTLGSALVLQADAQGVVRFVRTEPGPLPVEVEHPAVRARALLIDSARGTLLTGPRGR